MLLSQKCARLQIRTVAEKGDLEEPIGFVALLVHQQAYLTLTKKT